MKKLPKLLLAILLVLSLSLSICACDVIDNILGKDCESHVDADKDGKCDECEAPVETQPECTHSDKDDDGKCDECTADFTDGCDNHVDANDDGKCDVAGCNEACIDGCDNHVDANRDHVCDSNGCSVVIGTCADADLDHDCDYGCSKVWGDHADADLDHDCDYGCNVAIGDHADADLDHDCDYGCNVAIGDHADADLDHDCDYGCNVAIGVHADADLDHDCDYGCNVAIGVHADADLDHNCDYGCSVAFGTCEDADKDHACDYGCDATFGTEEDKDDDRKCDYCGEAFEDGCDAQHRDANDDGKCDFGGEDFEDGAEPIVLTEDVEVMGSAKSVGQELIYKLTASTTGAYGIEFWGSYFDINVYCEDTSTQAIYTKTGIISSHNDTVSLEEGEVYYFVLTYQENFESYVYLTVSAPEAEEPEASENGESFNTAFTLENGVVKEGDWNYNTTYYKFISTATGSYRIVIGNASYYDINIYSADDLTTAINTWSTEYSGNLEQIVELEEGETYYIVLKSNYGYGYKLTVSYRPECTAHEDANDDAKCDVCGDTYTDGCDLKDCLDINNDGLCDNANCDEATENKAEGSTFDNAIDLALDTATAANITLSGQKIYFKFTATSDWHNIKVSGYYSTIAIYDVNDTTNSKFNASGSSGAVNKLFEITEGNEYYLVIGSTSTYNYTVTLSTASDPFGSATELVASEDVQNIEFAAKQEKYFVYNATVTGNHPIYIDAGYSNVTLTLYGADKTVIAGPINGTYSYDTYGYIINTTLEMTADETYYIVIASGSSSANTFDVTFTAPAAGDTEPEEPVADGTSFEKAYELVLGTKLSGTASSNTVYYKLVPAVSGSYRVVFNANYYALNMYNAVDLENATALGTTGYLYEAAKYSVELTAGETYYFVLIPQYSYYGYEITLSKKVDCSAHVDSDDNALCDVCEDNFTDGCDQQECLDVNGDGLCDNANCDEATENKAAGATFGNAIDLVIGTDATANVIISGQKVYFEFVANATKLDLAINGSYPRYALYSADDTTTAISSASSYGTSITATLEGLTVGATYYIAVSNYYNYSATYTVLLSEWADPFETAEELVIGEKSVSLAAGKEKHYVYTATVTGDYIIRVEASMDHSAIKIHGADKQLIATFNSAYDSQVGSWGGYASTATQTLTAGETYYIVVASASTYSATYKVIFTAPTVEQPEQPECTEHVDAKNNDTDAAEADGKCDVCGEDMPAAEPEEEAGFETATELVEGVAATAEVTAVGQKFYYKLTASATGTYDVECWGYVNINVYKADDLATHFDTLAHMYGSIFGSLDLVEGTTYYFEVTTTESYGSVELTLTAPAAE